MRLHRSFTVASTFAGWVTLFSPLCLAQFSANIQGVAQDPSGWAVPEATVTLTNPATRVTSTIWTVH